MGALIAMCCLLALPASAAAFTRAFTDDAWFTGSPSDNAQWVARTAGTGAKLVLLEVDWTGIERSAPPPSVDPTNPAGPEYDFASLDGRIREFASSGLQVALLVTDAPRWAEAPGGPPQYEAAGSWEPNATAYGQVATALAKRYSGYYRDPLTGGTLPRISYYQAWAEANFSIHLAPQWAWSGSRWVPYAPQMYRTLLNAFYNGIKSVHSDNFVITTGFGPYGDGPGPGNGSTCENPGYGAGCRTHPALFAQNLLCLGSARSSCSDPAHFDALAMDPYEVAAPTTKAFNAGDISAPDLGKLTRLLKKAGKAGTALPRGHKQLWVTEFSYDSNPPNPQAVSLTTQARWLEEAFYLFWKQGVSAAVWYLVRDQTPSYTPGHYYSGVYSYNGAPKPALRAYQFPFVVWPHGRRATVWGISPSSGSVTVQRLHGRSWKTLLRFRVSAGGVFTRSIKRSLRGKFRAVVGGEQSLTWNR